MIFLLTTAVNIRKKINKKLKKIKKIGYGLSANLWRLYDGLGTVLQPFYDGFMSILWRIWNGLWSGFGLGMNGYVRFYDGSIDEFTTDLVRI